MSPNINAADVVAVNLQFKDNNGQTATRTFYVEKGMELNLGGKNSQTSTYKITDDGVVNSSSGKKVNSIMTTKEHVAALQGLSQVNSDSNIPRGEKESVLTTNDIMTSGYWDEYLKMQVKVNNQLDRIGASQRLHEKDWGYRIYTGEFCMDLTGDNDDYTSISVSSSSTREAAAATKKAEEEKCWYNKLAKWFAKWF